MTRASILLAFALGTIGLSACAAVTVVDTAASVVGTAVSTTADVAGSAVGAVTSSGKPECKDGKTPDGKDC